MARRFTVAILSDIHYPGPAERQRGDDYEYAPLTNPLLRWSVKFFKKYIWLKHPMRHHVLLDRFLAEVGTVDWVVGNGDYPCGSAWIGLADDATYESARECVGKLRAAFPDRLSLNFGDHELGKLNLAGDRGGLRLASWERLTGGLNLPPCWRIELGNYVLLGVASTLVALPSFERDMPPSERAAWYSLRDQHLQETRRAFEVLQSHQRVLLFCHDPTALPYLWRESAVKGRMHQIEHTIIGHLHSKLYLRKSRLLAGMPVIRFLGGSIQRMSAALNEARKWDDFRIRLCPSLAGIELLKDGGYLTVELDGEAREPARFQFHPLPR